MVFRWKITRPAFQSVAQGVEVMHPGMEVEFETGSIAEAHGIYQDSGSALGEMFGSERLEAFGQVAASIEAPTGQGVVGSVKVGETNVEPEAPKERKPRGRPRAEAVAPAPIAIPGAEAPPIAPEAPTAIAPPPAPPAPPAAPAAPPTGIVAGKIIAELEKRATCAADLGQGLADWLATSGITVKGATFSEAVTVLRLQGDEKLGPIATALGV